MRKLCDDILEAFESRISRNPDGGGGVALLENGAEVSYAELLAEAENVANALRDAGVEPDSFARIAVLGRDSSGYVALALGIQMAGGVLVSAGAETPGREFRGLLERVAADFAVVSRELLIGLELFSDISRSATIKAFSAEFAVFNKSEFPAEGVSSDSPDFSETEFRALNPAFIRFSSGTTGDSKGVVLSHETIIARTEAANSAFELDENDTVLWMLPMAHHFAATIMLFLREGCAIDIAVNDAPKKILAKLADGSVSFVYATPYHYARLAAAAADGVRAIHSNVKLLVSTAMPLTGDVASGFHERFGRRMNQAYGIIECGLPCVNMNPLSDEDVLSVGTPTEGFEIKTDDEVLVRGPGLFDAYLSPWTLRRDVLDERGWFHTGDLGRLDDDGRLFLTGRSKSVINFLGLKIFPEKVETVLNSRSDIRESRVFGVPHKDFGEIPVAEFVPEEESTIPNPVELTWFCSARLAAHETPQEFIPVASIPKTSSGKILRAGT